MSKPPAYLVESVLRKGLVNLIYGPSGSNKTTWVLQLIDSLASGRPFLDQFTPNYALPQTHYIALDRPEEEFDEKLTNHFSNLRGRLHFSSLFEELEFLRGVQTVFPKVKEGTKLLILDGIGFVIEGKNLIEQRGIGIVTSKCYKWAKTNGATIILIHHTAKSKQGQGYNNAREKAAGSGAWAQTCATSVLLEPTTADVEDPNREATIMQNNAPGRKLALTMTPAGLAKRAVELANEFTREELRVVLGISSEATLTRRISELINTGYLVRTGQGTYSGFLPPNVSLPS